VIIDADNLGALRERHGAWGLLRYEHAPLAVAFLHRVFVAPNVRSVAQPDLVEALEDDLHALRTAASRPRHGRRWTTWSSGRRMSAAGCGGSIRRTLTSRIST
jgi:Protein of unknown function (DUF3375)